MKVFMTDLARRYLASVSKRPQLSHGAVRVGLWLTEYALQVDDVEFDLFVPKSIQAGTPLVPAITVSIPTIRGGIRALEKEGLLRVDESDKSMNGRYAKHITLTLD